MHAYRGSFDVSQFRQIVIALAPRLRAACDLVPKRELGEAVA
jgi:hypothetical protein